MTNNEETPDVEQEQENNEVEESTEVEETTDEVDWKAEALKYKSINERLQKKINEPVKKQEQTVIKGDSKMEEKIERLELRQQGYTDEAIDFLMEYGGTKALKNKYVQTAVKSLEEEIKQQKAVDDVEGDSGSGVRRKHTINDLRKMSAKDIEKALAE